MSQETPPQVNTPAPMPSGYIAARRVSVVAACFCAIVLALVIANSIWSKAGDPVNAVRLTRMEADLNRHPSDQKLKAAIRELDAGVRTRYFQGRANAVNGTYFLIAGVIVYLLALEVASRYRKELPTPRPEAGETAWLSAAIGRRAVTAVGAVLAGTLAALVVLSRHDAAAEYSRAVGAAGKGTYHSFGLPGGSGAGRPSVPTPMNQGAGAQPLTGTLGAPPTPVGGTLGAAPGGTSLSPMPITKPGGAAPQPAQKYVGGPPVKIEAPIPAAWAENWPAFRGPGMNGVASVTGLPEKFGPGNGILWKTAIPLPGWNSPIVWGNRVFCSGGDKTHREIYAIDTATGAIAWKRPLPVPKGTEDLQLSPDTGYAPSTMVTDGTRVYSIFPQGDVVAVEMSGQVAWHREFGKLENMYGHAASLAMYSTGLVVQLDQGGAAEDRKSFLYALDSATGKDVWKIERPTGATWSTPIVIKANGKDLIVTAGKPFVIAYNAANGSEAWRADCLGGEIAVTPTYSDGFVLACNQGSNLAAIRPDGVGTVTNTHIAWMFTENLPDITSPLAANGLLTMVTTEGTITCVEIATGKKLWEHSLEVTVKASPTLVGNRIWIVDGKGEVHILEAGREYKEAGKGEIGEESFAGPAFAGGRAYLRGKDHLFCVGAK